MITEPVERQTLIAFNSPNGEKAAGLDRLSGIECMSQFSEDKSFCCDLSDAPQDTFAP
jgi:hypothetical protein